MRISAKRFVGIENYHYPHAVAESDSYTMQTKIQELASSKTVNRCYHATDPGAMMSAFYDAEKFKMFIGDTGLFITFAFTLETQRDIFIFQWSVHCPDTRRAARLSSDTVR